MTSLDHAFRENVVYHLYTEAQRRQVIVFTHDSVFISELLDTFDKNDKNDKVSLYNVNRAAGTGIVAEGPPWHLMDVNKRIAQLNERCTEARRFWKANDHAAYESYTKETLQLLGQAWERAVEEVALYKTVQRFGRQVQTQRLPKVLLLTEQDVARVSAGMGLRSSQTHDQAAAAVQPIPGPDEAEARVAELKAFCKELRKRQQ